MHKLLITGANRGLGLEFVRQYSLLGHRVIACCRKPAEAEALQQLSRQHGCISVHQLELNNPVEIEALAHALRNDSLDILLNVAAVCEAPGVDFGNLQTDEWLKVLHVNCIGPVLLAEKLLPQLERGSAKIVASLSSRKGSIGSNRTGREIIYRTSKAALNAAVKCLSVDLKDRGITSVALYPGWVRTDMGGPDAQFSPQESVEMLRAILDTLTIESTGEFISYDGSRIPW